MPQAKSSHLFERGGWIPAHHFDGRAVRTDRLVREIPNGIPNRALDLGRHNPCVFHLLTSRLLIIPFLVNGGMKEQGVPANRAAAMTSPFRTRQERAQDREEKREAVLRAAVGMFNARGFQAASLDDVAASLGISKPTIYHYLGNKEQVLIECVTRGLEMLRAAADEARAGPGNGLTRLRYFLRRYAEVIMDDFGRCVVRTGEELLSEEGAARFRARKREIDMALRASIEEGIADGSIVTTDVRLLAFTLAGALNWSARWHRPDGPASSIALAEQMVDILTASLAPR